MNTKRLLAVMLLTAVLLAGCTSQSTSATDPLAIAQQRQQVSQFLQSHPDASTSVVLWQSNRIQNEQQRITEQCRTALQPQNDYYRVTASAESASVTAWINPSTKRVVCVTKTTGTSQISASQAIQTVKDSESYEILTTSYAGPNSPNITVVKLTEANIQTARQQTLQPDDLQAQQNDTQSQNRLRWLALRFGNFTLTPSYAVMVKVEERTGRLYQVSLQGDIKTEVPLSTIQERVSGGTQLAEGTGRGFSN